MRPFLLDRAGVRAPQDVELGVAADHRRHEVRGSAGAAADHTCEAERTYRLPFAPQVERTLLLEGEPAGGLGCPFGDQGLAWACRGLQSRGHDDRLAGDHRIACRWAGRRDDLSGVDADPDLQRHVVCPAEVGIDVLQRALHGMGRAQRSGRVVLMGVRHAEHRHHGIADELLDGSALSLDLRPHGVEVALHHSAQPFRVQPVGQRGRPHDVGEQDRDELAFLAVRCEGRLRSVLRPSSRRGFRSGSRTGRWAGAAGRRRRQVGAKAVPHDEQNLAPSAFTAPHAGHVITTRSLGAAHRGAATEPHRGGLAVAG